MSVNQDANLITNTPNTDKTTLIFKPSARLISITPDAEKTITYIARVSNPSKQTNLNSERLIRGCINQHPSHWSIFEQASMTIEVEVQQAISAQILRHKNFCFQQFSCRYADAGLLNKSIPLFELRAQDNTNRQNSTDTLSDEIKNKYLDKIEAHFTEAMNLYHDMINDGVAKECARFVLPVAFQTRMYITGNIRSWIFYIINRTANGVQKEHKDIAQLCKNIFIEQLPIVSAALSWK
jgi:thymidylate synthase (FAD)